MASTYHNKDHIMEVECDGCSETLELEGDFYECISELKEDEGWQIRKEGGSFTHYCEDCKKGEQDG